MATSATTTTAPRVGPMIGRWAVPALWVTLPFAAGNPVIGALVTSVGWPAAWFGARSLHGLAQRWVVFVPAGFVLHDLMAVTDPVLLPKRLVASIGPALADTDATDYTLGAL